MMWLHPLQRIVELWRNLSDWIADLHLLELLDIDDDRPEVRPLSRKLPAQSHTALPGPPPVTTKNQASSILWMFS